MKTFITLVFIFSTCITQPLRAQMICAGISYRPYANDFFSDQFGSSFLGLKNVDLTGLWFFDESYVATLTYNHCNLKSGNYTIAANTVKTAVGFYKESRRTGTIHSFTLGANFSPSDYTLSVAFADPMGSVFQNTYSKHKVNWAFEGSYLFIANLEGRFYFKGQVSMTLQPDASNPFDSDPIRGYKGYPRYSGAGGILPYYNLLVSAGLFLRLN